MSEGRREEGHGMRGGGTWEEGRRRGGDEERRSLAAPCG